MAGEKLFGRYHDVVLLLTGFVLTTLVGGYLSQRWQRAGAVLQREAEDRRLEREGATRLFEDVSRMMDRRLYRMRRVHDAQQTSARDADQRWEAYRESLFEWNENLNRRLALTQRYFGDEARTVLEYGIQDGFRQLGGLLEGRGYPDSVTARHAFRQQVADSLNNVIYRFDVRLVTAIQRGEVGEFRTGP